VFLDSARTTGSALVIVGMAAPLGWILTREQVPATVANAIMSVSEDPVVILILVNLLLLVIGTFMEMLAAMIIMVPILLPLVVAAGMDPVHFGIIVAINLTLGMITPPVGICLFIGSTIAQLPLERVAWATMPFLLVSIVILYVITFSPGLVMWLPDIWSR
jgi:C4-dicarboxylate transporter, DctM subunit